jgi:starch synthase
MKVVQTVHAKYHHFDLARQFHRQGMLAAIFTGYPRWKLRDEGLPPDKIRTFPWLRTVLMAQYRHGLVNPWLDRQLNWLAGQTLDAHVAARLPECDVFVGISGAGLKTSAVVKRRGGHYICDRGSAHIGFTERILREEFKRWNQTLPAFDSRMVAKEEHEYAAADVITVPSQFCVRSFVEMGVPAGKIRRLPYGVELGRFRPTTSPASDRFEVLFVGAVSFQKGVPYLLGAFERLKHPRKRLRLVGAVSEEMKAFLRERKFDGVEFVGAVPQPELVPMMSASHVLVLPSIQDGFGLVLGQAMACGCPVICSTHTAGEDLVRDGVGGFVVPIRDPGAIAERLEQLCQDPELRGRMSRAALKRVRQLGGWDEYGTQYGQLCRQLAERSRSGEPAIPRQYAPVT